MSKRQGNDPKRRIARQGAIAPGVLERLAGEIRYVGSAHHKRRPADYGFHPPTGPRPGKSVCDLGRSVKLREAQVLFREGIRRGMVSGFTMGRFPKYVWAVDDEGRAYEAIRGSDRTYHGYELGGGDEAMRQWVIEEWGVRCPTN